MGEPGGADGSFLRALRNIAAAGDSHGVVA
jgi:hypothetical protein